MARFLHARFPHAMPCLGEAYPPSSLSPVGPWGAVVIAIHIRVG